ncbi:MAG TPA: dolichyl-phosphate-mannose-protein mannosyltransferase [Vicinamibacteria bacterium]|nr:dolichyl-phosphate-mannose-protein mannosyltransferase [Vicinamibacteria bacterium]
MDWKKKMEEMKGKADGVKAKIDKDGDGTPDAVENVMAKAREAAEAARAKLGEMKARLDKDGDGTPDAIENMSEQARQAIEQAKAKAAEIAKAAQEKLGKKPADNA